MSLDSVKQKIEMHLTEIKKFFVPSIELTFIARLPGNDRADFVLTNDKLPEVAKVIERSAFLAGDESEVRTLRDLERQYAQQLGEMARLCDTVCSAVLSFSNTDVFPENELKAAAAIMEYVDAVRPPEGSADPKWVMHIVGPDDVIDMPSQFAALKAANDHNKTYAKFMETDPSPNNPYCVALAKNSAAEEI